MRAKIIEALEACGGGPLNASVLKVAAFGGGKVDAAQYAEVLHNLSRVGVIRSRKVNHWVGRNGRGCLVYELRTVTQLKAKTDAKLANVIAYLTPLDRISVLDVIQREVVRAQESGDQEGAGQWLRIAFVASQVFGPEDVATDEVAS